LDAVEGCEVLGYFPIVDLEFDCRGEVDQFITDRDTSRITFTILGGEIKSSSSGIPKAKTQLSKRLGVMKEALKLMPHYNKAATPTIVTRGIIFLPVSESKCMIGKGYSPPVSLDYSLDVVFC
jgi:hypothetical protein